MFALTGTTSLEGLYMAEALRVQVIAKQMFPSSLDALMAYSQGMTSAEYSRSRHCEKATYRKRLERARLAVAARSIPSACYNSVLALPEPSAQPRLTMKDVGLLLALSAGRSLDDIAADGLQVSGSCFRPWTRPNPVSKAVMYLQHRVGARTAGELVMMAMAWGVVRAERVEPTPAWAEDEEEDGGAFQPASDLEPSVLFPDRDLSAKAERALRDTPTIPTGKVHRDPRAPYPWVEPDDWYINHR
jgi:hypothetical protein